MSLPEVRTTPGTFDYSFCADTHYNISNPTEDTKSNVETEGVLFEETIGGVPENDNESTRDHNCKHTFVDDNNKEVTAGAYLRSIMRKQPVSMTERNSRYQGKSKSGTEVKEDHSNVDIGNDAIRAAECPIATIVACTTKNEATRLALAILSPQHFVVDGKNCNEVSLGDFEKKDLIVKGNIVSVRTSIDGLQWTCSKKSVEEVEIRSCNAVVLNPQISALEETLEFYIDMATLKAVLQKLCLEYEMKKTTLPNAAKYHVSLPYSLGKEHILYTTVEDASSVLSSKSKKVETRDDSATVTCAVPGCKENFPLKVIRHHAAWHIQHDEKLLHKLTYEHATMSNLCGICAARCATTESSDPGDRCPVWLEKKGRTIQFMYDCRNHPFTKISLKAAQKFSKTAPSTNVPIECPECKAQKVNYHVYKYNFQCHWNERHPDTDIPTELKSEIAISDAELKEILKFKKSKGSKSIAQSNKILGKNTASQDKMQLAVSSPVLSPGRDNANTVFDPSMGPGVKKGGTVQSPLKVESAQSCEPIMLLQERPAAERERAYAIILASCLKRIQIIKYRYKDHSITEDVISTLRGVRFINGDLMEMQITILNKRNSERIAADTKYPKCMIVNSYFPVSLLGLGMSSSSQSSCFSKMEEDDIVFRKQEVRPFKNLASKWHATLFGESCDVCTVIELVHINKLDSIVIQVNIPGYHWFDVAVSFNAKAVTLYDSMASSVFNALTTCIEMPSVDNCQVLAQLTDRKMKDLEIEYLGKLCVSVGIQPSGNRVDMLRLLMRPMILQEIMSWLKNENERTPREEQRISFANWKLAISSIMPQQSAGSNACGLYTMAAADILSSGGEVSFINRELLEKEGRRNMAAICCIDFGEKIEE